MPGRMTLTAFIATIRLSRDDNEKTSNEVWGVPHA